MLDEIGHIEPPTIMPTQRPPIHNINKVVEPPSSDLFDGIDEDDMAMPALQTSIHAQQCTLQTTIPVRTFEAGTLLSRSRPALGESPTTVAPIVPQISSTVERLPYPINPDGFTPELFTQNLVSLIPLLSDASQRVSLSSISSIDRLSKVPLVIGMITAMDQPTGRDYLVTISDETGSIAVTVHDQVPREARKKLHYGMIMVLADCSIFRPSLKSQCLIVVPRNVRYLISNLFNTS